MQYSQAVANAKLDAIETTITSTAWLGIYTGTIPANVAAATTGTLCASITLPADWMAAATGGAKSKSGTWQDTSADATGSPVTYFRIFTGAAVSTTTPQMQGSVGTSGTDMIVDSTSFTAGQAFTINTFTITTATANYP